MIAQPARRLARTGTMTQLETFAPYTTRRSRYSLTSRGRLLLAATDELDLPEELEALRATIRDRQVRNETIPRFIPLSYHPTEVLELPEIDEVSLPEEIVKTLEGIADYFALWSKEGLVEGPASLFADMRHIQRCLKQIFKLGYDVFASAAITATIKELTAHYESFVETWSETVQQTLLSRLARLKVQLRARVNHRPTTIHESEIDLFASDILAVSPDSTMHILLTSTYDNVSFLVSKYTAMEFLESTDQLLYAYQAATYVTEQKELWLLIWRSLKTAFLAFQRGGAPSSPTNTLRDRQFFEVPIINEQMQRLVRVPESCQSAIIEEMVGMYCLYIHECSIDPGNKYESLNRTHDMPLGIHTKNALEEFVRSGKFETSTLSKLHFAVARFNKINNGPVMVRRCEDGHDHGTWESIPVNSYMPMYSVQSPPFTAHGKVRKASHTLQPPAVQPMSSNEAKCIAVEQPKRIFPHPEGLNLKSDFDYVRCPFPETRAHEVAMNEQMCRELAQPGIVSEGLRPEYLINVPPRHVRDFPDLFDKKLGPITFFRLLIQRVLAERSVPKVKVPSFTRLASWRNRRPTILTKRPGVRVRNARVHKPAVVDHLQPTGLPVPIGGITSSRQHIIKR